MLIKKEITIVEEKKYYKELIIDMINKMDRVDGLIYLYHFIKGKFGVSSGTNQDLNK